MLDHAPMIFNGVQCPFYLNWIYIMIWWFILDFRFLTMIHVSSIGVPFLDQNWIYIQNGRINYVILKL